MSVKKEPWLTLIGGGPASRPAYRAAKGLAPRVFAVDGGANHLKAWGERPEAILGDLDSLEDLDWWASQKDVYVLKTPDQETTDFEKALDRLEAEITLGLGFLGGRLDHALAALHALAARPERRILLLGEREVVFLAPPLWRARLKPGDRLSIWPIRPTTVSRSSGLRWPLDPLRLEAGLRIGVSNEVSAPEVSAEFDAPGALILLPRSRLEAAVESLLSAPGFV
ncbi:thiamine diphosphokinase [Neomegalonema perideroedes]|uniref:thiamine diphosphokinase n=1 Tax=Neomegalonema perideroedes TaxID=217219 RepID=UPI000594EA06|nr:thiamine diphosphokinase [Neomegalonema perideroedes]